MNSQTDNLSQRPNDVQRAWATLENRLGDFVRISEIGRGGCGRVWKGYDLRLNRYVAIKQISEGDPEASARILREAQIAARLSHPNIVSVHDSGMHEGHPYIVMALIDGEALGERPLPVVEALEAIRVAALAVHYAHEQGIVHRDLKPGNLMRDRSGRIFVLDFGLARDGEGSVTLTQTGSVYGTPQYMPPEQARGRMKNLDARSDVYSLGATLYHLVTGAAPFRGDSALDVLESVIKDEVVRPSKLVAKLPREVEIIILKCLEKTPSRRYPTARALAQDIERFQRGEAIMARPTSRIYKIQKLVTRHKSLSALVALASFIVAFVLFSILYPSFARVDSQPAGAAIRLNGRDTGRRTPATVVLWPPGRHRIQVVRDGYDEWQQEIQTRAAQVLPVSTALVSNTGCLSVSSQPPGARVILESGAKVRYQFETPVRSAPVARGVYRITLQKDGFQPLTDAVEITSGAGATLEKTLQPDTGTLSVCGNVDGMMMHLHSLDRVDLPDRTIALPIHELAVPTGRYTARFTARTCFDRSREIQIAAGRTTQIQATLFSYVRWSTRVVQPVPKFVQVEYADLDRDGVADCIVWGGNLCALSGVDGRELWHRDIEAQRAFLTHTDEDGDGVEDICVIENDREGFFVSGRTGGIIRRFELPASPLSFWFSDINNDGHLKYVHKSGDTDLVLKDLRTGKTTWSSPLASPLGGITMIATAADFDADGVRDLITLDNNNVLRAISGRDGKILWRCSGASPWIKTNADLDGDGIPDLVTFKAQNGRLEAISGKDGTTLWQFVPPAENYYFVASIKAGKANNVAYTTSKSVRALSGKSGQTLWTRQLDVSSRVEPAIGDIDHDGFEDILVMSDAGDLIVLSGRDGSVLLRLATGIQNAFISLFDLDADGHPECIITTRDGTITTVSLCPPDEGWEVNLNYGDPRLDEFALWGAADVNGDGRTEIIVSHDNEALALSAIDGRIVTRIYAPGRIHWLGLTDVDRDGTLDWILHDGVVDIRAISGRTHQTLWTRPAGEGFLNYVDGFADLDGDGVADPLLIFKDHLHCFSGASGKLLWKIPTRPLAHAPRLVDLNGNKTPQVIISDQRLVALSGKDGKEVWHADMQALVGHPLVVDLNGDGFPDYLTFHSSHLVAVSGKDGSILWKGADKFACFDSLPVGDIDGDGRPDLLLCGYTGIFAVSGSDGRILWKWRGLWDAVEVIDDIDGDGQQDIAVTGIRASLGSDDDHWSEPKATQLSLLILSGKTGRMIREFPAFDRSPGTAMRSKPRGRVLWYVRTNDGKRLLVAAKSNGRVRAFFLPSEQKDPEPAALDQEIRRALVCSPTMCLTPEQCDAFLGRTRNILARRQLLVSKIRALAYDRRWNDALGAVEQLRQTGDDTAGLYALWFVCEPKTEHALEAVKRDPIGAYTLITEYQHLWSKRTQDPSIPVESLALPSRVVAHLLNQDYDLALDDLNTMRQNQSSETTTCTESLFPSSPLVYLRRAVALSKEPIRASALCEMALARADAPRRFGILLDTGQMYLQMGNLKRARELLRAAHRVAPNEEAKHQIESLLKGCEEVH